MNNIDYHTKDSACTGEDLYHDVCICDDGKPCAVHNCGYESCYCPSSDDRKK